MRTHHRKPGPRSGAQRLYTLFFYAVMPLQVARGVAPTRPGAPSLETARSGHGAAVEKKL